MSDQHHTYRALKLMELYGVSFVWLVALSGCVGWIVFYGFPADLGRDYFASQLFPLYAHPRNEGLSLWQFVAWVSAFSYGRALLPLALLLIAKARSLSPRTAWRKSFYSRAMFWLVAVSVATYALGWILFLRQPPEGNSSCIAEEMKLFWMGFAAIGWLLLLPSVQLRRRSS